MSNIVNSLRKHQKLIILGAALGVISLYFIPIDQIVSAIPPQGQKGIDNAVAHIQLSRDRIQANTHIPDDVQQRVDAHLEALQYRLLGL